MTTAIDVETVAPEQALAVREAAPAALEHVPAPTTPAQAKVDAIAELTRTAYQKASQLELTDAEIADLTADFPDEAFKPGAAGKENLIYIEHAFLRDRLNKVFRPGRWSIIPRSRWAEEFKTTKGNLASRVYVEAMLVIRGCFAAEAVGEMEYYPNNASQNYADACEGAKTAALRRCCKELGIGLQAWKKDWCEGWWQRRTAPKAAKRPESPTPKVANPAPITQNAPSGSPKASPAPNSGTVAHSPSADHETYAKVLRSEEPKVSGTVMADAYTYGNKCLARLVKAIGEMPNPASKAVAWSVACEAGWIIPTEDLADMPLDKVPLTKLEFDDFVQAINNGLVDHHTVDSAVDGYAQTHPKAGEPPPEVKAAIAQGTQTPRTPKDNEYWREVIVTVPRKGMKKTEYEKSPDTIGSLYDMRHGSDDEAAAARSRLFGLVQNWKADGWTNAQGKHYPPSAADTKCRLALDDFWAYFEREHPGERL